MVPIPKSWSKDPCPSEELDGPITRVNLTDKAMILTIGCVSFVATILFMIAIVYLYYNIKWSKAGFTTYNGTTNTLPSTIPESVRENIDRFPYNRIFPHVRREDFAHESIGMAMGRKMVVPATHDSVASLPLGDNASLRTEDTTRPSTLEGVEGVMERAHFGGKKKVGLAYRGVEI